MIRIFKSCIILNVDQINRTPFPTLQAEELCGALKSKGINAISEYFDGYKHVDIAIPDAKLFIEVDGLQHTVDPDEIENDFKREFYSHKEGVTTIHIPNIIVNYYLPEIVRSIEEVVKRRINK